MTQQNARSLNRKRKWRKIASTFSATDKTTCCPLPDSDTNVLSVVVATCAIAATTYGQWLGVFYFDGILHPVGSDTRTGSRNKLRRLPVRLMMLLPVLAPVHLLYLWLSTFKNCSMQYISDRLRLSVLIIIGFRSLSGAINLCRHSLRNV